MKAYEGLTTTESLYLAHLLAVVPELKPYLDSSDIGPESPGIENKEVLK